jgi:hypothetical protein
MNFSMKMAAMINMIKKNGVATIIAASDTHERLTKKSRSTKEPRPEFLEGLVCYTKSVVSLGFDYNDLVRGEMEKGLGDPSQWKSEASKVSQPDPDFANGIVRQGISNPQQKYVRVYIEQGPIKIKPELIYINAKGEDVTSLITQEIRDDFFPIGYGSEKQLVSGSLNEVKPREYKLENLKGIVCEEIEHICETTPSYVKEKFGV